MHAVQSEIIYFCNLVDIMRLPHVDNTARIAWSNHVTGGRDRAKHIDKRP
jgi:hypothetical protein